MAVDSANKDFYENLLSTVLAAQLAEQSQDAVGAMLVDTDDIDLAYVDVTPALTATLKKTAITAKTNVTAASNDEILIADTSDSGNLKKVAVSSITSLAAVADGDKGDIAVSGGGATWTLESGYIAVSANNSIFRVGTLEFQCNSNGSDLIMGNLYWDGSNLVRRTADYGEMLHLIDGEFRFAMVGTGSAGGTTAYPATQLFTLASGGNTSHVDLTVPYEAYGSGWNGSNEAPTKDAVYDKIEAVVAAVPTLAAGTYTPTLDNTTNVSSSTAYQCQYMRVGATVTVSGRVDLTSSGIGDTVLGISLPVSSNIGAVEDCAGVAGNDDSSSFTGGIIRGNVANDRAELFWYATSGSSRNVYFTFTYQVI